MSFDLILKKVTQRFPQVIGTIFCDYEGEMINFVKQTEDCFDNFELKLIGATSTAWVHNISSVSQKTTHGLTLSVCCYNFNIIVIGLKEGYHLTVISKPNALVSPIIPFTKQIAEQLEAEF